MAHITEEFCNNGFRFDFFQATSLLEEFFAKKGIITEAAESGHIRFVADKSITFPPSDISCIKQSEDGYILMLTFMGLVGISSPLPQYFSDYVLRFEENAAALNDFLAIFNHRIYTLFYRAWKKYSFIQSFRTNINNPVCRRIAALAGVRLEPDQQIPSNIARLLAYSGLFSMHSRSCAALENILSDFFGSIPVKVHQWVPQWREVPDIAYVGVDTRLGVNTLVGNRVYDIAGKIRVSVGPLSKAQFDTFLPDSENIQLMRQCIQLFLADPLDFDIEIKLQAVDLVPVYLSEEKAILGVNSSLGLSTQKSDVTAIVIECK